ncbi:hypothetical protein [Marinagarivorans algicola]|uniref:hypothetical protein n=1 Tax=Marinagarivorans algicola TaxID=1513270 RepID=UPI0006B8CF24|nr:hypothetical protein [Marinagarivorans algicola]
MSWLSFYRGVFLRVSHWVNSRNTRRAYFPVGFTAASLRLRALRLFPQRLGNLGSSVKIFGGAV